MSQDILLPRFLARPHHISGTPMLIILNIFGIPTAYLVPLHSTSVDKPVAHYRAKGLGLGLASEAEFEFETLPPTFSIVADARLRCLPELRTTLVRSLTQREYRGSQNKVFRKLFSELSGGRSSFVRG